MHNVRITITQSGRQARISVPAPRPSVRVSPLRAYYGESAYQLAVSEGFDGTLEEWLFSLKGEPGNDADATALVTDLRDQVLEHEANHANPHAVTKAQLGLGSVQDLAPLAMPVSTAQAAADVAVASSAANDASAKDAITLQAAKDYADSKVVGLWNDRGSYDASGNLYPAGGGSGINGAVRKGDIWTISANGVLGSRIVDVGDVVRALADVPGQSNANWAQGENNLGYAPLSPANNLSELSSAALARVNLGLGSAAVQPVEAFEAAGAATAARAAAVQRVNHTGTQVAATISDFSAAALAVPIAAVDTATVAVPTAADSILSAIGKLIAKAAPSTQSFTVGVRSTALSTLSVVTSRAITATDSILTAMGLLQAQLNVLTRRVTWVQLMAVTGMADGDEYTVTDYAPRQKWYYNILTAKWLPQSGRVSLKTVSYASFTGSTTTTAFAGASAVVPAGMLSTGWRVRHAGLFERNSSGVGTTTIYTRASNISLDVRTLSTTVICLSEDSDAYVVSDTQIRRGGSLARNASSTSANQFTLPTVPSLAANDTTLDFAVNLTNAADSVQMYAGVIELYAP